MARQEYTDQPTFDIFATPEGVSGPVDPAKRAETAAHIAEVSQRFSPYEQRTSEAFADLGGGTSEEGASALPRSQTTSYTRRPIGNVRDVEPRDSDLDPYWNAPSPQLSAEDKDAARRGVEEARRDLHRATAPALFDYLQQFPPHQQQAILRAREERRGR